MHENRPPDRFRAGVGIVIVAPDGRVMAFRRSMPGGAWQLPQGGIDEGEDEAVATMRELFEETGIAACDVDVVGVVEPWLGYELPAGARSPKTGRGQVHRWTVMRPRVAQLDPQLADGGEFDAWAWMTFSDLHSATAEFRRPVYEFLETAVQRMMARFGHRS
jgi:putative (di)nucleoside polyphosphate hydrolase